MSEQYNVQFINPILRAVLNVLSTMANVEVTPGKPYLNNNGLAVGDITGSVGIDGYAIGVISLSLSKGVVLTIVNNMLYENFTEINEEIADAVGELTNMISGQARSILSESDISFSAGTPKVIHGKGEKIDHIPSVPVLAVPFSSSHGDLVVEISLSNS
ncbi:MAG: chemotaxis protein CheX [Desulfonatronovibrio sp. MSAO_Bac4]|nr:MAG: chemotaxis protein CheX [Desulfonatronovibrio sp. MSAO_Bac4]